MTEKADQMLWRCRPYQKLQTAAELLCVAPATIYRLEASGKLTFKRLTGKTVVETEGLVALLDGAEPWVPSDRSRKAIATRVARSKDAWTD